MPVKIGTLVQLFLFAVSLGLFVMAALTFTRRRQTHQSGLLVLVMCAGAGQNTHFDQVDNVRLARASLRAAFIEAMGCLVPHRVRSIALLAP